jgi:hypothetical protein
MSLKIYLALPYSDELPSVMERRFQLAVKKVGELLNAGHIVLCPVVHYHPVAEVCDLPRDWEFWEKFDVPMVDWADEVWVLMLPGWDESIGVKAECDLARELGKPILYLLK